MRLTSIYLRSFFAVFVVIVSLASNQALAAYLEVLQFREVRHENAPAAKVRFSQKLDTSTIESNVSLVSNLKPDEQVPWILDKDGRSLIFPFVQPSTSYNLKVEPNIRSVNGDKLGSYYYKSLKIRRVNPVASFASTGYVLTHGGVKELPVTVVNVDQVNVDFFQIPVTEYDEFLRTGLSSGTKSNYLINRFAKKANLIYSSRFDISPNENQRTHANLDVSHISELNESGLYVAVMGAAGQYQSSQSVIYFTVSDLGLHVRQYAQTLFAHVMNIYSGDVEQDVELELYDNKGQLSGKVNSDAQGVAELPLYKNNSSFLVARKQGQVTVLPLRNQALDLSDFKNAMTPHSDVQVFSFGPRDLFRPGETATVQMLVRDHDGKQLSELPLSVQLKRPDGQVVITSVVQPQAAGYYQFNYALPTKAQTGDWRLSYQTSGQDINQNYTFKVEEFRPNRLELNQLLDAESEFDGGDKLLLNNHKTVDNKVEGKYLFGALASGNKVDGRVIASLDRHPLSEFKQFYFGDEREKVYSPSRRLSAIHLDGEGQGVLSLNNRWTNIKSPLKLDYTLSLYETGGRPVVDKSQLTLIQKAGLVGIKPGFSGRPNKNTQVQFQIKAFDTTLALAADSPLEVILQREDRSYYWSHNSRRGWYLEYDASPYESWSRNITTDESGAASVEVPVEHGYYKLIVSNSRTGVTSTYSFKTGGLWWENSVESKNKPETLLMNFEQDHYQHGDTAKLNFVSPHAGSALLTVENNQGVLLKRQIQVQEGKGQLEFDIPTDWDRHDNYASLMVIKYTSDNKVSPKRAFGLTHLPLQRAGYELAVQITTDEKTRPLQTVTATVQVDQPQQLQGDTYATVALVDVGILNLTKYKTPNPEDYFLAPRRYQADLYDVYNKIIVSGSGQRLHQAFGGDFVNSDEELTRGGKKPKTDVELVSLLAQPVKLDSQGKAEIQFELPDFAGKLRWSVVVFNGQQFGSAEAYTKVASPLVSQLSAPYFMTPGDSSTVALDIHNLMETSQTIRVNVELGGGLDKQNHEQQQQLAPSAKTTLYFPITANANENMGEIRYRIENSDPLESVSFAKQERVPIRSAYPAVTRSRYFSIDEGESWSVDLPFDDLETGSLEAQLTLSSTPPIDFNQHFSYLLRYPYGCLEQTTSTAMPWLKADPALVAQLSLDNTIKSRMGETFSPQLRLEQLESAIERLGQKQRSDGSFSLWNGTGDDYSWLTVYATDFLFEAAKAGVTVPRSMLNPALSVLSRYVKRSNAVNYRYWFKSRDYYKFSVRAYASYVLAKANRINLSDVRRLTLLDKTEHELGSLPWMHLASAYTLLGANGDADMALDKAQDFKRPKGYFGDYGSDVRDMAWSLALALKHDLDMEIELAELQMAIKSRRWLSTQDRGQLFNLAAQLRASDDEFTAQLLTEVAGQSRQQALNNLSRFNSVFDHSALAKLKQVRSEQETVYGSLSVVGYSKQPPKKKDDVIDIEKHYYDLDGKAINLANLKAGELVVVELLVASSKNLPDGLIVDLLPAGLALENQNLAHASVDLSKVKINGNDISQPSAAIKHQEYREDRYVAAVHLRRNGERRIYYLARAVIPGEYQVPPVYVEDMFNPGVYGLSDSQRMRITVPD